MVSRRKALTRFRSWLRYFERYDERHLAPSRGLEKAYNVFVVADFRRHVNTNWRRPDD